MTCGKMAARARATTQELEGRGGAIYAASAGREGIPENPPVESVLKLIVFHPQTVQPPQHGVADDRDLFGGFNGGQIILHSSAA